MLILKDLDLDTVVSNLSGTQRGQVVEIRLHRPAMVKIAWKDGTMGWYHPEQLARPGTSMLPQDGKKTAWGRTTPAYLVGLRADLRKAAQPAPASARTLALRKIFDDRAPTRRELALFGIGWPPPKGWKKRLLRELRGTDAKGL